MFWVGFTDEPLIKLEPTETDGRIGLLVLGRHEERFPVQLSVWCEQQYVGHWRSALVRALDGQPSALITDMATPAQSSHLIWWPMWRIKSEVVFHNQLLFFKQHGIEESPIDSEHLYGVIGRRMSHNDEGIALSEWSVSVSDVETFLAGGLVLPKTYLRD
jgi:CdiI N-terminal domain